MHELWNVHINKMALWTISYIAVLSLVLVHVVLYNMMADFYSGTTASAQYLWTSLRKNVDLSKYEWIFESDAIKLRDSYTVKDVSEEAIIKRSLSKNGYNFYLKYLSRLKDFRHFYEFMNETIITAALLQSKKTTDYIIRQFNISETYKYHKSVFRYMAKKYKSLYTVDQANLSNRLGDIIEKRYNTDIKFDYKRLLTDPKFTVYYQTRVLHPIHLKFFYLWVMDKVIW